MAMSGPTWRPRVPPMSERRDSMTSTQESPEELTMRRGVSSKRSLHCDARTSRICTVRSESSRVTLTSGSRPRSRRKVAVLRESGDMFILVAIRFTSPSLNVMTPSGCGASSVPSKVTLPLAMVEKIYGYMIRTSFPRDTCRLLNAIFVDLESITPGYGTSRADSSAFSSVSSCSSDPGSGPESSSFDATSAAAASSVCAPFEDMARWLPDSSTSFWR
mmetsp:Transcript_13341/g.33846  ORF Transcript_13341/g.33846 Transcript_13341/m.33846 type:complete len:218 (-) Transcript_13341:2358-3011(-)